VEIGKGRRGGASREENGDELERAREKKKREEEGKFY
jgi:hypothetical protein